MMLKSYFTERYEAAKARGAVDRDGMAILHGHSSVIDDEDRRVCNTDTQLLIERHSDDEFAGWISPLKEGDDQVCVSIGGVAVVTQGTIEIVLCGRDVVVDNEQGSPLQCVDGPESEGLCRSLEGYNFLPRIPGALCTRMQTVLDR